MSKANRRQHKHIRIHHHRPSLTPWRTKARANYLTPLSVGNNYHVGIKYSYSASRSEQPTKWRLDSDFPCLSAVLLVCSIRISIILYRLRRDVNAQIYHICISARMPCVRSSSKTFKFYRRSLFSFFLHSFVKLLLAHRFFFIRSSKQTRE